MNVLNKNPHWKTLKQSQKAMDKKNLRQLFQEDNHRFEKFSRSACGIFLDFSKNKIDDAIFAELIQLAETQELAKNISSLFAGEAINITEQRPALHTALRRPVSKPLLVKGKDIMQTIAEARHKMENFVNNIQQQQILSSTNEPFTDVVNIGIGGSDLGPLMVGKALADYKTAKLHFHSIANIDDYYLQLVLAKLNPRSTLFIISSKSFSTIETLTNMQSAKAWLCQNLGSDAAWQKHAVAVTANIKKAQMTGFADERIFPLWDWVGGRYSVWSSVGLPVALMLGVKQFNDFLAGAHAMDEHFQQTDFPNNLPVILGLLEIWYRNFWQLSSHAIIPYLEKLVKLPSYLQQLVMESNGKSCNRNGLHLEYATSGVIWGESGTPCQHSFMQLLHQGSDIIPVDFIIGMKEGFDQIHQNILLANALAQSSVLMQGKTHEEALQELTELGVSTRMAEQLAPHKVLAGNRPSNTLLFDKLTPYTLGALISLYEHKVFTCATLWDINAFDQWGVEMGKTSAEVILADLQKLNRQLNYDQSTNELLNLILKSRD